MGRRRTETAQPQTNARRARWQLERTLRLLYNPPTDHEPTIDRLRGIGAEVRAEIRRVARKGGSFEAQLDATMKLLDHRPMHPASDASLREWAEGHLASLDAARKRWLGSPRKLAGGTLDKDTYYSVDGDTRGWLVPDDELPPV